MLLISYGLATLNVIVIVAGFLLGQQAMQASETAVTTSGAFERQLVSVLNFSDAVTDAQAIASDSSQTDNTAQVKDAFLAKTADARREIDSIRKYAAENFLVPASARGRSNGILSRLDEALGGMEQHALAAFDQQAAGNSRAALSEVKQIQQRYVALRSDMRDISRLSAVQWNGSLQDYRSNIAGLRNYGFVIGGLLLALVCGALFHGHFISVLMRRNQAELQAAAEASSRAQADAQAFSIQLQSVNEDIIRLNRDVQANLARQGGAHDERKAKNRLSQLGQLTATVAHELRNPLGAVRTSAFLLERKIKGKGLGVEPQLERIGNGITRCDNIISQLLDFARTKELQSETLAFDDWLAKLLEEEVLKLPAAVAVDGQLGLGEMRVSFDPARMSRVVINLLANASEALVGKGDDPTKFAVKSPRISISTQATERGVELTIADNGLGIPADQQDKIFEPLFTTKNFGTGLGLPAVEKILEQHGGGIEVHSEPGQGAKFTIWWPLQATEEGVA